VGTFSARFAELTGMSPTAYRQEAARRGGPAPIPGCFALMWRSGLPVAWGEIEPGNTSLPEKAPPPARP